MEEAVLENVHTDEADEQWNKYHETNGKGIAAKPKPSEKQKTYIVSLAKTVGLKVDVSTIRDKESASRFIERLKQLSSQMNGNGHAHELRDKRIAFGMATKLMFRRYSEQQKDPTKWKRFWKDVHAFYKAYQEEQELATNRVA